MSGPVYYSGTIPLRDDVTFTDVLNLYHAEDCDREGFWKKRGDEDAQPELPLDVESEFFDWNDELTLTFEGGTLIYHVDMGDQAYSWTDNFENFLKAMIEKSTGGWASYEGHEPEQVVEYYGASDLLKAKAELEVAEANLTHAQAQLEAAQKKVADAATQTQ